MIAPSADLAPTGPVLDTIRAAALDRLCTTREPGWLAAFVRRAWHIVDPEHPLVWNWHLTLMCAELERVADGRTRELVLCVPTGASKSLVASVLFPAGLWLRAPGLQILGISNLPDLAIRDALRMKDLVTSEWYRGLVERLAREESIGLDDDGQPWDIRPDQRAKNNYLNTVRGGRQVGSIGGTITGKRCHGLIVDDPYDASEAFHGSPAQIAGAMKAAIQEYDGVLKTRPHPKRGWRVVIMQRLDPDDLAGELIKRGVRACVIPFTFDPDLPHHPRDPRTRGELYFPALYDAAWLADIGSGDDGPRIVAAQLEQRPTSAGGRLFPRIWFAIPSTRGVGAQRYNGPPAALARGLDTIAISVDCTFGDTKNADRVAIHAWGWKDANRFLLDRVADRMTIGGTIAAVVGMRSRWNAITPGVAKVRFTLFERKANGQAVIDLFEGQVPGVLGYTPRASKYARAQIASYAYQAGNIWLPHPDHAPWVAEFTELHVGFTGAAGGADDDIDAESQLMIHLDDADAQKPDDVLARITGRMGFLAKRPG